MAYVTMDTSRLPANGVYSIVQSGLVVLTYNGGAREEITGDFTYSGGQITGGWITRNVVTVGADVVFSITDFAVPAVSYFNARLGGDAAGMANLLFSGSDQFFGGAAADVIGGGAGNDTIIAMDGTDTVDGGAGDDDVNGNMSNDIVHGGDGNDWVRGGKDADTIYGDAGDDPHVNGNIGNDLVFGGTGNDTVYGGQDQDTLHGDAGDDLLSGDLGNDILYGDAGADRFVLRAGSNLDWVADFNPGEGDRIQLAAGTSYSVGAISGQVVIDLGGGDQLGLAGVAEGSFSSGWIVFA